MELPNHRHSLNHSHCHHSIIWLMLNSKREPRSSKRWCISMRNRLKKIVARNRNFLRTRISLIWTPSACMAISAPMCALAKIAMITLFIASTVSNNSVRHCTIMTINPSQFESNNFKNAFEIGSLQILPSCKPLRAIDLHYRKCKIPLANFTAKNSVWFEALNKRSSFPSKTRSWRSKLRKMINPG